MKKYLKLDDPDALAASYAYYAQKITPRVPYIGDKGVQTALDQLKAGKSKATPAKPSDFYDNRFVKELDDSGFIKKLYE